MRRLNGDLCDAVGTDSANDEIEQIADGHVGHRSKPSTFAVKLITNRSAPAATVAKIAIK